MRFAVVTYRISKEGGIERCVSELVDFLANQGHRIDLYVADGSRAPRFNSLVRIIDCHGFFPRPLWVGILQFMIIASVKMSANRYDVIHCFGSPLLFRKADLMTAQSVHEQGMRIVYVDGQSFLKKILLYIKLWTFLYTPLQRISFKLSRFSYCTSISNQISAQLVQTFKFPAQNIVLIPNGVSIQEFQSQFAKRHVLRRENRLKSEFVISFVGKEYYRKGLDLALRILSCLGKRYGLLVIGDNSEKLPDKSFYSSLVKDLDIEDQIAFVGHVTDVQKYLAMSDLFLFPSRYEPFGMAIIEAMAAGLPVIISDRCGVIDFLDKKTYIDFSIEQPASVIADLVRDVAANIEMHSRIAREAAMKFDWNIVLPKYLEVYRSIVIRKETL